MKPKPPVFFCLIAALLSMQGYMSAATITVNPATSSTLTKARKVGLNVEMSLLSDQMRLANGQWIDEILTGSGVPVLRWGYGAWEWDWNNETPLGFDYWSKYNLKNDAESYGLREFIARCKAGNIVPMLMIPVEIQKFPEHTWDSIKVMAGAMASYINSQGLTTPVYFELGNEPAFLVPQSTYETRLVEMSAVINGVNTAFKFGASVDGPGTPYNPTTLINNVGSSIDFIDFHRYASLSYWTGYYNKDNDTFFSHVAISKEAFMGECNILWPDWNGRMPNDLQGSLPLLNALLSLIEANTEQYITTWPSHWHSQNANEPYGLFNYDAWFTSHQTRLFTGPIYAHRILNENVLDSRLTGETSSDAKLRVFGYTNAAKSRLHLIVINKKPTAESVTINTTQAFGYVQAFAFQGAPLDTESPTYQAHLAAMTPVGSSSFVNTVPAQSAVVYNFYNDAAAAAPGTFSLNAPSASATNVSTFKTFSWTAAANAQSYRLTISTNSTFTTLVFDREVGLQTQYQVIEPVLNNSTTYYWKVVAKNKTGQTNASGNGRSFSTAAASTIPYWSGALANGSFEDGFNGWNNWDNAKRTSTTGEVITGTYSGKIGQPSGGLGQEVFGLVPGSTYQLHATTKATSALDAVSLGITFYNSAGTQLSESTWPLPQTVNRLNSVYSFTIPAGTWRATVWFWKEGGNGYLYVDSFATTDITRDNTDTTGVVITGTWAGSTVSPGFVGSNYIHDGNTGKGSKSIVYRPTLASAGPYEVFVSYSAATNRATNVPVTISHTGGTSNLTLNQQTGGDWVRLGSWNFAAGTTGSVTISNTGTNGYVIADAVRFAPIALHNPGFEDTNNYWADWGNSSSLTGNAHGGSRSLRSGTAAGGRGQTITASAGKTYTLSGWGRVSVTGETGFIGVSFYTSGNVKISQQTLEFTSTSYLGESLLFTTPTGTAYITVWLWKDAGVGGYFYADDLSLVRQ